VRVVDEKVLREYTGVYQWERDAFPVPQEDVRFSNGEIQLAGTLISPNRGTKHPAIVLVHGSDANEARSADMK
jgi:hypothetical protein